jgi:hypothetical protein
LEEKDMLGSASPPHSSKPVASATDSKEFSKGKWRELRSRWWSGP